MSEIRLSASLYQRFLDCPRSAAYSINEETKHLSRTSLRAALGMVAHSLVENCSRIPSEWSEDQISVWFEVNWEKYVAEQLESLENTWSPGKVPKPQSWPGYFATRAAAKTLVLKNSALLPPKNPSHAGVRMSSKPEELKFPLVEKFLVSNELGIFGKPDFVFLEDDTLTIYDYKFGRNQDDLEKYRFQMLFYQLLVESVTNLKVGKLAIVASASRVFEISVQKSDIENLKAEIPRVLNAIKSSNVVAIPSQRNCKFCSFKAVCESFKRANIELHPGRPMAILGEIIAAKRIDSEFQELTVKTILMSDVENFRVFGIPNSHFFEVGESVFISDNLEFMDEKTIKFSWNSRISLEG